MHREGVLKIGGPERTQHPMIRLVDSRGKRLNNNKISIYSQKYVAIPAQESRQQIKLGRFSEKKGPIENVMTMTAPLSRPLYSAEGRDDSHLKQMCSEEKSLKTTSSIEITNENHHLPMRQQPFWGQINSFIDTVRQHYEAKISQIIQENNRSVNFLRSTLIEQQQKIAEKQELINRILNGSQSRLSLQKPVVRFSIGDSPLKANQSKSPANIEFLTSRIQDLEKKMGLVIEQFGQNQTQLKGKIEQFEHLLIRNIGNRVKKIWSSLESFLKINENKMIQISNRLLDFSKQQQHLLSINTKIEEANKKNQGQIRQKMQELFNEINLFKNRQFKYENQNIAILHQTLFGLQQKFNIVNKNRSSGGQQSLNNYFFQDEDQFFYPSSDRTPYEPNDQYEHFQQEPQDDFSTQIKQNIDRNHQTFGFSFQKTKRL